MNEESQYNYERISKTINFIKNNFQEQPTLNEMAEHLNLSPHHFQKLFKSWIGISPKKYLQYITIEYAKELLNKNNLSLLDTSYELGLSSTSRLYDLFTKIEGMTPGEFKTKGENLIIYYNLIDTTLGKLLIASTKKAICFISFEETEEEALFELNLRFKNAKFIQLKNTIQKNTQDILNNINNINVTKLLLNNSPFQIKIWETLLKKEIKNLITYCEIGKKLNNPKLSIATSSSIHKETIRFIAS